MLLLSFNFFSNICPGDWTQFLSGLMATIIGTLIGIFGPFCLQAKENHKHEKHRALEYLHDINQELNEVKLQFMRIKDANLYLSPIKTPLWDSLINTNEIHLLSLLKIKKEITSKNLIKQLFQVYDLIKEYNLWWSMYAQGAIIGERKKDDLQPIQSFFEETQKKLLCTDKKNDEYNQSINYALDIINEVIALLDS